MRRAAGQDAAAAGIGGAAALEPQPHRRAACAAAPAGANMVPAHVFEPAVTPGRLRQLVGAARAAHMNMLRVWGGGRYAREAFYDACDELGVLVWQEAMFACAPYPADDAFLREASRSSAPGRSGACSSCGRVPVAQRRLRTAPGAASRGGCKQRPVRWPCGTACPPWLLSAGGLGAAPVLCPAGLARGALPGGAAQRAPQHCGVGRQQRKRGAAGRAAGRAAVLARARRRRVRRPGRAPF